MKLQKDICDVGLWLCRAFKMASAYLRVDPHYDQMEWQAADVVAMMSCTHPDPMTPAARAAFRTLGYDINDAEADRYDC